MFPDPLQAIAAFARVAHHASFKRCRIGPVPREIFTAGT